MFALSKPLPMALLLLTLTTGCSGTDDDDGTPTAPTGDTPTQNQGGTDTPGQVTPVPECTDDQDSDGFVRSGCKNGDDCDDLNANVHPGAAEGIDTNADGVPEGDFADNDCDGVIDNGTTFGDDDDDGFCEGPSCSDGSQPGDCNDVAPAINPDGLEQCDTVDNDCNGVIDDVDQDDDGYIALACQGGNDCDDVNESVHPNAPEGGDTNSDGTLEADGRDNDCDGTTDEDTDATDDDLDGFSELQGDCDDNDVVVYPNAIERFDGKDQNCDGVTQAGTTAAAAPVSFFGAQTGSKTGQSVGGGGDINVDGYDDLVVGAPGYDVTNGAGIANLDTGMAYLVGGRQTGWNVGVNLDTSTPRFVLADAPGSRLGWSAQIVGDISGDGVADFAMGAPGYVVNNNENTGGVFVYPGTAAGYVGDQAINDIDTIGGSSSFGLSANVEYGYSLAGGMDVTADGISDLLIGYPWDVSNPPSRAQGYVSIFPGRYSGLPPEIKAGDLASISGAANESIGWAMALVGDIDRVAEPGGGLPSEMLISSKGDSTRSGKVYLVPGNDDFAAPGPKVLANMPTVSWNGDAQDEFVGSSPTLLGDLNQDGFNDFAFGRNGRTTSEAMAYVVQTSGVVPTGGAAESETTLKIKGGEADSCPCRIAGIGDFNGDGLSDFVVSASRSGGGGIPTGAGKIYLFFGRSGGFFPEGVNSVDVSTSDYFFTGEAQDDGFGYTLTAVGDVNGDGFDDFAVGAPAADISGTGAIKDAGKVYVFFGFSP